MSAVRVVSPAFVIKIASFEAFALFVMVNMELPWVVLPMPTVPFGCKYNCDVLTPMLPWMPRFATGELVPMPTRPPFVTTKLVWVEEPTANAGPEMPFGFTESWAHGVVVPTPTVPSLAKATFTAP